MKRDVFISYSRKNYNVVMEIKSQIDDATGADCWMDLKGGIETGAARYDTEIIEGIKSCNVFLFMLSNQSQESENAIGEIDLAKARGKRIVLVNIDNCELNDYFILHYGRADIIYWQNELQREKLIRDLKKWVYPNNSNLSKSGYAPLSDPKRDDDWKPIDFPKSMLGKTIELKDLRDLGII